MKNEIPTAISVVCAAMIILASIQEGKTQGIFLALAIMSLILVNLEYKRLLDKDKEGQTSDSTSSFNLPNA